MKMNLSVLGKLFLLFLLSLILSGCNEQTIYTQPFITTVKGRVIVCLQTLSYARQQDSFIMYSSVEENFENWTAKENLSGRLVGQLPGDKKTSLVFASGSVIDFQFNEGKFNSQPRSNFPQKLVSAAGTATDIWGLSQTGNELQVLRLTKKKWLSQIPALEIAGTITKPRLAIFAGQPLVIWQHKNKSSTLPEQSVLRLVVFKEGKWQNMILPETDFSGGNVSVLANQDNLLLALAEQPPSMLQNFWNIRIMRWDGSSWTEIKSDHILKNIETTGNIKLSLTLSKSKILGLASTGTKVYLFSSDESGSEFGNAQLLPGSEASEGFADWLWLGTMAAFLFFGIALQFLQRRTALKQKSLKAKEGKTESQSGNSAPNAKAKLPVNANTVGIGGAASPLERALALMIDYILLLPLAFAFLAAQKIDLQELLNNSEDIIPKITPVAFAFNFFFMLYATITEIFWGQTIGKRILGLKVKSLTGGKSSNLRLVVRNLFRSIDNMVLPIPGMQVPFFPALLSMIFSRSNQRIGDRFAATVVVRRVPIASRKIILASTSPRRKELLETLGLQFEVLAPTCREDFYPRHTPEETALRRANLKAENVAKRLSGSEIVIAADTVVSLDGEMIGKPRDREDAREILSRLSGSQHQVITALAIIDRGCNRQVAAYDSTRIQMGPLSQDDIDNYVNSGEADGKAGAYAIQENGDRFVRFRQGSFSNVVGLPIELLQTMLDDFEA